MSLRENTVGKQIKYAVSEHFTDTFGINILRLACKLINNI